PNLSEELCKVLELPANRVAVRGVDAIQNLTKEAHIPLTPELVTPIGIAIAAKKQPVQYMSVTVNEQVVRLFELKEMTVGDAFLAANIRAKQLYGKPGHGLSITVNGQDIFVPGGHGEPAKILVNGEEASTKTKISNGDVIVLEEGKDGLDAVATVRDLIGDISQVIVTIQGIAYNLEPKILLNGTLSSIDEKLSDRDSLVVETIHTIEQALAATNNASLAAKLGQFIIQVDNKPIILPNFSSELIVNGNPGKINYPVQNGDIIEFKQAASPTAQDIAQFLNVTLEDNMVVTFQNEQLELQRTVREVVVNGVVVAPTSLVLNGATVQFKQKDSSKWIYQDVFRYSNWQLPTTFKGVFNILRNGEPSSFDAEIFGGDILEIQLIEHPVTT
ncbi:MAG: cell division protein, partial [Lysinibacillus sp.]